MTSANCASVYKPTSLANTITAKPKFLKPDISSSISTPRSPKKPARRKNHLRPKILETLTKPFSIEPVIPIISQPEQDTVYDYEPTVDEIEGIVPAVEEAEEIRVVETEGVAGEYSGIFGKFSARSALRIGLGLVAVFALQTICTAWVLGEADSDEKNKNMNALKKSVNGTNGRNILVKRNMVYLDKTFDEKLNEIRAMAREAREIEGRELKNGEEESDIIDESGNSNGRIGIEREIGVRLAKVEKKLKSRKGKLPGSYTSLLNESKDAEEKKEEDNTLMFKKKFKFRSPSMSLRCNVKWFSSSESRGVNEKKNSGLSGANDDQRESFSGVVEVEKNVNETFSANSNYLQNDTENLEKMSKEMGVGDSDIRFGTVQGEGRPVEVGNSRKSKGLEMQNLQNFMEENQETPVKFNKHDMFGRNDGSEQGVMEDKPSTNVTRANKSDIKSDLWWSNLPYVLAILMERGLEHEETGDLFTLRIPSEVQDQSKASYTVAFEDRGDANNFCYLLESFFEYLGDFDVDIVPLSVKELLEAVKSSTKKVIAVKKGQLKLYAGQPFEDVEKALHSLVEQNTTNVT